MNCIGGLLVANFARFEVKFEFFYLFENNITTITKSVL
jgi:hypothetical protein